MNKKMKKLLSKLGLVLTVTAISTTSLMAEEVQQEAPFSRWAAEDIYDAQNYGIVDATWVQDGMKGAIDATTFTGLQQLVQNKLAEIPGTKLKAEQTPLTASEVITKQEVLNMLYTTLQNNEYEHGLKLDLEGEDVISYMQELEVVQGDGKSLGLDSPCTEEQAVVMARRFIEGVYDVCDADSTGLFWKVEKNGNTVYMLGAIHLGRASMYPMNDEIENAYDAADELAVEINILQPATQEAIDIQMYSDGTTIKDHISEEYYEKLTEVLKKYNLTPEAYGKFKDWAISNDLSTAQMIDTSGGQGVQAINVDGVDRYCMTTALIKSKPITELESYKFQFEVLDSKGQNLKTYELETTIDSILEGKKASEEELNEYAKSVDYMVQCINDGEAEKLNEIIEADKQTERLEIEELQAEKDAFNKRFYDDRDKGMAEKVEAMLNGTEGKTYFVTVGAAHYISDTGIIKYLKDKGYEVTQIK